MGKGKYKWDVIQKFCDKKTRTWREVSKKFGACFDTIHNAVKNGHLIFNGKFNSSKNRYNWKKIQSDLLMGMTWEEITSKYGCSESSILKARRTGKIKTLNRSQAMKISCKKHPRKHSQETKSKISRIRKAYLKKHPDKVPYILNHYSKGDSYPEKYFKGLFKRENIRLKKDHNVGTYWLDFASLGKKVDIEIDGNQHRDDPAIVKHDKNRTKWLVNKGWKVYRILWSDYKKKTIEEKKKVIGVIRKMVS
jgi:very-short-patch-repair endonuclease